MRSLKKLSCLAVVVFALSAISVANASASAFTYSATGELTGRALETQKFKVNAGTIECKKVDMSGTLTVVPPTSEQEMTATYTECIAFGLPVHITGSIKYLFTANGRMHIKTPINFTATGGIFGECTITVGEQEVGSVSYTNNSGKLKVTPNPLAGISYTSTGGLCGSSGTNGEFSGASEIERVGGGSISWDA